MLVYWEKQEIPSFSRVAAYLQNDKQQMRIVQAKHQNNNTGNQWKEGLVSTGMSERGCELFVWSLILIGTQINVEERKGKESQCKINKINSSTEMLQPLIYLETSKKSLWVTTRFMTGKMRNKSEKGDYHQKMSKRYEQIHRKTN